MLPHIIRIIVILAVAFLITKFGRKIIEKIVKEKVKDRARGISKRQKTLIVVFNDIFYVVIWLVAIMMVLFEFGINVGPLLAGAGIIGVMFGFGAQYIIRDFLVGFFIILENQYRIGDVVCLGETCGTVENITLRKTTLRDLDGIVHHVPNGEIKKASNLSKSFSRVNLNIGVSYNEDLEKVINILNGVGEALASEPKWKDFFVEESLTKSIAPKALGVDDFTDSGMIIKMVGSTKAHKQWDVARELRKRIKIAFDKEGIRMVSSKSK